MTEQTTQQLERAARAYLEQQLGGRAPAALAGPALFDETPLEGEGATALFSFDLPPECAPTQAAEGPAGDPRHYVAVGATTPNYFPAYGLDADDAYSFHVGTRFMLELGVAVADASDEPPGARDELHTFVDACNPGEPIESEALAALFRCGEQRFAVYRLRLRGVEVYCLGADCPPGFYQMADRPPQVPLRLHLGKLIRAEAREEAERRARQVRAAE
jgi:hypothetical protein